MEAMKNAGACGFTDDGIPLLDADFCYRAMEHAAKLGVPVSLHEEDPSFIQNNGINHGAISEKLGIYGSPSIAEESLVARDCFWHFAPAQMLLSSYQLWCLCRNGPHF